MNLGLRSHIAVVGAGMAGAACAQALAEAGYTVEVFDKSRGPGGRLATRRFEWVDGEGRVQVARLDHGARAVTARTAEFQAFLAQGVAEGWMAEWSPVPADGHPLLMERGERLYLPVPDMPELCRQLLRGPNREKGPSEPQSPTPTPTLTAPFLVDQLQAGPLGWQLAAGESQVGPRFDAVLLAIPPAQAAALLSPHRADWARQAAATPMQPCWTLMGVAECTAAPSWNLARSPSGPLEWVMRSELRPGREPVPGQAHWVAHARADWSLRHLEESAEWVQARLQAALADFMRHAVRWRGATVHRWRYASPAPDLAEKSDSFWWDSVLGLGVCGDFLGGAGVEGAWRSGRALADAVLEHPAPSPAPSLALLGEISP